MTTSTAGLARLVGTSRDGSRTWAVDGVMYDDDGLDRLIAKQHALIASESLVDREMGEALVGLDVDVRAREDLRARGIYEPTGEQLLAAYRRVSRHKGSVPRGEAV
jgi:hypothetical protein